MTLSRRSVLGVLAALPFVAKGLPSLAAESVTAPIAAPPYVWKPVSTTIMFGGVPVVLDPRSPPGMLYLMDSARFDEADQRSKRAHEQARSEQLFS